MKFPKKSPKGRERKRKGREKSCTFCKVTLSREPSKVSVKSFKFTKVVGVNIYLGN